jgi:polysaccharide export outer membrane protein
VSRHDSSVSLRALWQTIKRRRRLILTIEGGLLLLCILYCLFAPNQYEARARVRLRTSPATSLSGQSAESLATASVFSAPTALETVAGVLRSDQLAWKVITGLKLYQAAGFRGSFARRFPDFHPEAPSAAAQAWLLERFAWRLHVQSVPSTLLVEIRFRCRDAALSAEVVNALIRANGEQNTDSQLQATAQATGWLGEQLKDLKARVDADVERLIAFQTEHGLLNTPQTLPSGISGDTAHNSTLDEIDQLGRDLAAASTERILREAEYHAASQGDPELVLTSDSALQAENGGLDAKLLEQIRARRSDLELEQAQLSAEHGPNFPRVVEIGHQLEDLDRQKAAEDAALVERFRSRWQTAADREQMVRKNLEGLTGEGMKQNQAATEYAVMREEANASRELYMRVTEKVEEAGLASGIPASDLAVVDSARPPAKPVAPDLPLYMVITFFAGLWVAVGGALMMESISANGARAAALALILIAASALARAQAPIPSTSGLPSGVSKPTTSEDNRSQPNAKEAPTIWNGAQGSTQVTATSAQATIQIATPLPAPLGPGDVLVVSEFHAAEFRTTAQVAADGTVTLPMIGTIKLSGMNEQTAARAIEAQLLAKGMLLHPLVSVLVTAYAGQDVSVLGEVARPGVYPYTTHHRLLDLISAAQGLSSNAGRLVNIYHASDPKTLISVVLDPGGTDTTADHNPELSAGDTVQVSRAGLVYVVGDVIRPGGFPVDPAQGLTIVQALSLAWGPSQNAALGKALLIREQKGGRTLTTLNVKRLLHGQDPDQLVQDRDILYLPDSTAKNLWNRAEESAIQSAIGVAIYGGLVYSQWHVPKTTSTSVSTTTTGSSGSSTSTTTTTQ